MWLQFTGSWRIRCHCETRKMLRLAGIRRKVEEMAAKLLLFLNDLLIYNFLAFETPKKLPD